MKITLKLNEAMTKELLPPPDYATTTRLSSRSLKSMRLSAEEYQNFQRGLDKLESFYRLFGLKDKGYGGVNVEDDSVIKRLMSNGYKPEYAHKYSHERVEDPDSELYKEYPDSAWYTRVDGNTETRISIHKHYTLIYPDRPQPSLRYGLADYQEWEKEIRERCAGFSILGIDIMTDELTDGYELPPCKSGVHYNPDTSVPNSYSVVLARFGIQVYRGTLRGARQYIEKMR